MSLVTPDYEQCEVLEYRSSYLGFQTQPIVIHKSLSDNDQNTAVVRIQITDQQYNGQGPEQSDND